jgi:hypothetical protein
MHSTLHHRLALSFLCLVGLASSVAQAASSGGCIGTAQYYNGRFLGYTIAPNDPVVGYWIGTGFGNHVVNTVNNASAPVTGVSTVQIASNGSYVGGGWGRAGKGAFEWESEYTGNIYCLAAGKAYAAWNHIGLAHGVGYVVTLNGARDVAFLKDTIASRSTYNGSHEMNAIIKVPATINLTDAARVLNEAVTGTP